MKFRTRRIFLFLALSLSLSSTSFSTPQTRDELIAEATKSKAASDFAHAESLYRDWLKSYPHDDEVNFWLAQVLYWQGKNKEALAKLDALSALEPDNSDVRTEREKVIKAIDAGEVSVVRFALDFKNYDFFDKIGFGFRAGFSYMELKNWAIRAGGYAVQRFDINAVQGAVGASYWLMPRWAVELDVDGASPGDILPQFSGTIGTNYNIANIVTPSFAFRFAKYSNANVFIFTPGLSWSPLPELELTAKLFAALSMLPEDRTVATAAGLARANFMPFRYFSLFGGLAAGEEAFDPGNPNLPLGSFISETVFAGLKFTMDGHFGGEFSFEREWRSNNQNIVSAEAALFYTW